MGPCSICLSVTGFSLLASCPQISFMSSHTLFQLKTNSLIFGITLSGCVCLSLQMVCLLFSPVSYTSADRSFLLINQHFENHCCIITLTISFLTPKYSLVQKGLNKHLSDKRYTPYISHTQRCVRQIMWPCHLMHKDLKVYNQLLKHLALFHFMDVGIARPRIHLPSYGYLELNNQCFSSKSLDFYCRVLPCLLLLPALPMS